MCNPELQSQYQIYMKSITDMYINMLNINNSMPIEEQYTPSYKMIDDKVEFQYSLSNIGTKIWISYDVPDKMDGTIRRPLEVAYEWRKIMNETALLWLQKNLISYDDWYNKNFFEFQKQN
jgi:hypothetical protein